MGEVVVLVATDMLHRFCTSFLVSTGKKQGTMAGYADPPKDKQFVKGDSRINRKGRPKSFDALRALTQQIACEDIVGSDGTTRTAVEIIMRKMATENPERFLEIGFGKVPTPIEHTGKDGGPIETKRNVNVEIGKLTTEQIEQLIAIAESAQAQN